MQILRLRFAGYFYSLPGGQRSGQIARSPAVVAQAIVITSANVISSLCQRLRGHNDKYIRALVDDRLVIDRATAMIGNTVDNDAGAVCRKAWVIARMPG